MSSTGPKGPLGLDLSLLSGTSSHYSIREAQALAVKGTGLSVGSLPKRAATVDRHVTAIPVHPSDFLNKDIKKKLRKKAFHPLN